MMPSHELGEKGISPQAKLQLPFPLVMIGYRLALVCTFICRDGAIDSKAEFAFEQSAGVINPEIIPISTSDIAPAVGFAVLDKFNANLRNSVTESCKLKVSRSHSALYLRRLLEQPEHPLAWSQF
jgi:hypothetical protein